MKKQKTAKIEENFTGEGEWIAKITDKNGSIRYLNEFGELHRTDGPAQISWDGRQVYAKNGLIHREDGPAIIEKCGTIAYCINDKYHNENGPAIIHKLNGNEFFSEEYFLNGLRHREDGPAITWADGSYQYYQNNVLHRTNGPAISSVAENNQENTYDYYLNGRFVPKGLFKIYQLGCNIFKSESKIAKVLDESTTDAKKRKI